MEILQIIIPERMINQRIDWALSEMLPDYSRSKIAAWIKSGDALIDNKTFKPKDKVNGNEVVNLTLNQKQNNNWIAEKIPLNIVYEDESLLVLNKEAGRVVHPAVGNRNGTLLNGLLHSFPELKVIPRVGIVHRLDKDTTGIMVVAKTIESHTSLVAQLKRRSMKREYEAVVTGVLTGGGIVNATIGRHPVHRKKQAVVENGKEAITHYRVIKRFRSHTHVRLNLETGRTHQIRVHMAHINHRLVGDPLYGGRLQMPAASSPGFIDTLQAFKRQALHGKRLSLNHPLSGKQIEWEVEIPKDMRNLLSALKCDADIID